MYICIQGTLSCQTAESQIQVWLQGSFLASFQRFTISCMSFTLLFLCHMHRNVHNGMTAPPLPHSPCLAQTPPMHGMKVPPGLSSIDLLELLQNAGWHSTPRKCTTHITTIMCAKIEKEPTDAMQWHNTAHYSYWGLYLLMATLKFV